MTVDSLAEPAPEPHPVSSTCDVLLVGGGLSNALIAWQLKAERPDLDVRIVEKDATLGGNHTWSFHETDVSPAALRLLKPLVTHTWARQSVRFPNHTRVFDNPYHSISSERLHEVVGAALGSRAILSTSVVAVEPNRVTLADQSTIDARCVIDGRGLRPDSALALGYQKFVGLEVETEAPHGETMAVIMDATVPQLGGYRFFYTLPMTPTRILIEDTYYTDGPDLDRKAVAERVHAYAAGKGWRIKEVVREEKGVLPVVLTGDIDAFWHRAGTAIPRAGLRAALFHPTTGYSLPDAMATAELIGATPELSSAAVQRLIEDHSRSLWRDRAFFRLLNRLLFIAARPEERLGVMERFYRLPDALVARFFAGRLTVTDKAQILVGRPPVPIRRALRVINHEAGWAFVRRPSDAAR